MGGKIYNMRVLVYELQPFYEQQAQPPSMIRMMVKTTRARRRTTTPART